MIINNSVNVNTGPIVSGNGTLIARERREQEAQAAEVIEATQTNAVALNTSELVAQGELRQQERVQRLGQAENATFTEQQGIDQYAKILEAAQAFDGGELVGIDIIV